MHMMHQQRTIWGSLLGQNGWHARDTPMWMDLLYKTVGTLGMHQSRWGRGLAANSLILSTLHSSTSIFIPPLLLLVVTSSTCCLLPTTRILSPLHSTCIPLLEPPLSNIFNHHLHLPSTSILDTNQPNLPTWALRTLPSVPLLQFLAANCWGAIVDGFCCWPYLQQLGHLKVT